MILGWPPFKVVLRFQFHAEFWLPWQQAAKTKNFKNLFVDNYWPGFEYIIIWHKYSWGEPLLMLLNYFNPPKNMAARGRSIFIGKAIKCYVPSSLIWAIMVVFGVAGLTLAQILFQPTL